MVRTMSECTEEYGLPESPYPSLASLTDGATDGATDGVTDGDGNRKSVRFSERIVRHCFKAQSKILTPPGEGKNRSKKNQKRKMQRIRLNSAGSQCESSEQCTGSESESHSEGHSERRSSVDEEKGVQFTIDPIPEEAWDEALSEARRKRASNYRPVSVSDDEEESGPARVKSESGVGGGRDFDSEGDSESEPEVVAPAPAAEKKRKKKKKKSKKRGGKAGESIEERKGSADSGLGTDVPI